MEKREMKIITNTKMAGEASSGRQKTIMNNWLMTLMNALVKLRMLKLLLMKPYVQLERSIK